MEIFVVDDEEEIIEGIRRNLTLDDHEVSGASNKDDAIEKFKNQPYPIVLLDIKLPNVSGVELLKQFKKIRPLTNIIMITGFSSIENVIECMEKGAVDYFTKPLDMDELTKRINQIDEKVQRWEETVGIQELT